MRNRRRKKNRVDRELQHQEKVMLVKEQLGMLLSDDDHDKDDLDVLTQGEEEEEMLVFNEDDDEEIE